MRTCEFDFDGQAFKIASMSVREAEEFVEEGKRLLEKAKTDEVAAETWLRRRNEVILASLNKVAGEEAFRAETMKDEFDLPTLDALYSKILEFSGLKPGEVVAASNSQKSAAA